MTWRHSRSAKTILAFLPLFVLIVITIISMLPGREETSSVFLKAVTTEEKNYIRIDYVNENGQLTFALDLKYATVVKTYNEGKPTT